MSRCSANKIHPHLAHWENIGEGFARMNPPLPAAARSFRTMVNGVSMHAVAMSEDAGKSDVPFVLVHGLGMSSRYMMPTAELLAAHRSVYAPDLPGFGRSGKPPHVMSIPELSDMLAAWMESQGIHQAVMLGNSLGAQVIVDFSVRHPERVERAVLVGPTIDPEGRSVLTQALRLLVDIPEEPPALYGIGLTDYLRAGFWRVLGTLRYALADPILEKLPQVRCPVLVVRGGRDPIVPQRWVEQVAALIPNARHVTLDGVAHAVNFDAPGRLVKRVMEEMRGNGFHDGPP